MNVTCPDGTPADPQLEALVTELIGRVADKWTMIVLEVLGGTASCALPNWPA